MMRFTLKNPRSLQYIDYQNVRKNGIFRLSKSGNDYLNSYQMTDAPVPEAYTVLERLAELYAEMQ